MKFNTRFSKPLLLFIVLISCSINIYAQLRIYQGNDQTGNFGDCILRNIYKGTSIPSGLNNNFVSISLSKGFMATLAENEDGSGSGYSFAAVTNDLNVNLTDQLKNKVSFIRVLPLKATLKKGLGTKQNSSADKMNVSWFYDWGYFDYTTNNREYSLLAFTRGAANTNGVNNLIAKDSVSFLLSFNEPDNRDQGNITDFAEAVPLHKNLTATGYRLGSPAVTQGQALNNNTWLKNFMTKADNDNVRVDYMAIHWYDWDSYLSTKEQTPNVEGVFTRFKAYVNSIYKTYKRPIWITEFNSNPNTTSATHVNFMALALPWLEAQNYVERFAYFFPAALPPVDVNNNLTAMGSAYKNHTSTLALKNNLDGTPDTLSLEAENAVLTDIATVECATSSGGKTTVSQITGSQRVTFTNIFAPKNSSYKLRVFYFALSARNMGLKVNSNPINTIAIPVSGTKWCYQGGNSGFYDIDINLNSGMNTIEFSNSPLLDKIEVIKIPSSTVLPIKLLDFSAKVDEYGIRINWQTLQEINNSYFEILKADETSEFKVIRKIDGALHSNSTKYYSIMDSYPYNGNNYYQLKQYDVNGDFKIFGPISIKFGVPNDSFNILTASDSAINVSITSTTTKKGILSYYSIDGRILYEQNVNLNSGINLHTIPVQKNDGKIGIIKFYSNGKQQSLKVLR